MAATKKPTTTIPIELPSVLATSAMITEAMPIAISLAYEMMYGRDETPFLVAARRDGAGRAVDGLGMLVEQAAESCLVWRGVRPDTAPVRRMLRGL